MVIVSPVLYFWTSVCHSVRVVVPVSSWIVAVWSCPLGYWCGGFIWVMVAVSSSIGVFGCMSFIFILFLL